MTETGFGDIGDPRRIGILLDIDGTLLDVAATPDGVSVPPGFVETLTRLLERLDGALALVTGRPLADADWFFAPLKLIAAGVHGTELRVSLGGAIEQIAQPLDAALARALMGLSDLAPGVLVELKHAGAAIHYRNAAPVENTLEAALQHLLDGHATHKLTRGRKIFEVMTKGYSKGTAVETLARLPIMQGRQLIFIGDDASDEPAIAAVEALGGLGWRVAGEHFARASSRFSGPAAVREWLADFARETVAPAA